MMYRVSNVEAFRQWEADEETDTDWIIRRIRGDEPPTERMLAGTALHRALELAAPGTEISVVEQDGFRFRFVGDFEVRLTTIRELRGRKTYMVDGKPIVISGQVDQIEGKRVDDHKSTGRFDPDRYFEGFQWRLYLDIFAADHFRWNVFEMDQNDDGEWEVKAQHTLEQYRYPELHADCQALVERFARFVRAHIEPRSTYPTVTQAIAAEVGVTI